MIMLAIIFSIISASPKAVAWSENCRSIALRMLPDRYMEGLPDRRDIAAGLCNDPALEKEEAKARTYTQEKVKVVASKKALADVAKRLVDQQVANQKEIAGFRKRLSGCHGQPSNLVECADIENQLDFRTRMMSLELEELKRELDKINLTSDPNFKNLREQFNLYGARLDKWGQDFRSGK